MRSQEQHRQLVFFLAGFLIGVLYIYFTGSPGAGETDFLSIQNLMQVMYMDIVHEEYFWYLLRKRIGILILLVMTSLALPGKYLLVGFLMVFGCSMGSMLSVLLMRYGLKGILLFLGLIFPQDIVYIPVVFWWVCLLTGWNEGMFYQRNSLMKKRDAGYRTLLRVIALCGVTIIGVVLECYVNPFIVQWCLKIF